MGLAYWKRRCPHCDGEIDIEIWDGIQAVHLKKEGWQKEFMKQESSAGERDKAETQGMGEQELDESAAHVPPETDDSIAIEMRPLRERALETEDDSCEFETTDMGDYCWVHEAVYQCKSQKCPDCGGDIKIRNPTGHCDHLKYPEYKNEGE